MRSILLLTGLAACGGGGDGAPDAAVPVFDGGTITPTGCSYSVSTPMGATAPVVGSPVFGADPTPRLVHLGLAGDPRTTMVVSWRTTDETTQASTIRFGKGTATDQTAEGLTFLYQSDFTGKNTVRMHEAHLCGLEPDTQYSYQVGSVDAAGAEHFTPVTTFRTAPDLSADPSAQVTVAVAGDCRGAYDVWAQIIGQLQSRTPDVLLFTGDAVELGPLQSDWDQFFAAAEPLLKNVPMVAALGNHEVNAVNYFAQVALPGDEQDFALDYGAAHVDVLNDSPDDPGDITGKAKTFLDGDLTAHAGASFKIVMHHRALYSSSTHGSQQDLQQAWGPLYDAAGVDFVLNGHDHDYERSVPMKAGAPDSAGTVYVVQGGAGADLYPAGTSAFTAMSMSVHGATVLTIGPHQLDGTVFDPSGTMIDSFTKSK